MKSDTNRTHGLWLGELKTANPVIIIRSSNVTVFVN